MGSRLVRLALAIAISIVFVWLAFRDLDTQAVWASLTELGTAPVLVYVGSIFVIHLLRTYRWHLMVCALDPNQPFWQSLRISFLGFAAVFLVPLRLGEFARPLLLRRACSIPVSAGLGCFRSFTLDDGWGGWCYLWRRWHRLCHDGAHAPRR